MKKENIMPKKTDTPDYKPSIYSLTRDELIAWAILNMEKRNSVLHKSGTGSIKSVCKASMK